MTGYPRSPRLLKCGIVIVDPVTGAARRVIALQYNPEKLSRSLQVQTTGGEGGERSDVLRFKGPPVETIKLEADIDAADQLEFPQANRPAVDAGLLPQLAALEALVYPTSAQLRAQDARLSAGALEIIPMEAPLALLVWSRHRVVAVRVTEFSVTEEAFDPQLNPILAKVSLGLRVLSVADVGFSHRAGGVFMTYLRAKEQLGQRAVDGSLGALGLMGLP